MTPFKSVFALVALCSALAGCTSAGQLTPTASSAINTAYNDVCTALPALGPVSATMNADAKNAYAQAQTICAAGAPTNAIAAGVTISHVNFMTMDYGDSYGGHPLAPVVVGTHDDGHTQLMSLVPGISSEAAWAMVGVIPMIGKNDDSEIFSLAAATTLAQFVTANHVGLASFWSIDRDQTGSDYNTASTVESTDFAFNTIFEAAFK